MGAATEVEMKEKKDRVEDAQHATGCCRRGNPPRRRRAFIRCIPVLNSFINTLEGDEKTGARNHHESFEAPLRQIAENAGCEGSVIVQEVEKRGGNIGYDALLDRYVDMIEAGILDPAKVVRCALKNAASAAGMLLTTEATVVEIASEKEAPAMPHGGMGY